mmetsp:Transcript_27752/g.59816  ORF Transcript_27752/g.59816 Transcript_27752/m.59816 type:complete len:763 (-) Transcript_27752:195-2483(-)
MSAANEMQHPKRPSLALDDKSMNYKGLTQLQAVSEFSMLFDYVVVFEMVGAEQSPVAKFVIHAMLSAGLEVFPYLSVQSDELYCLVRCPLAKMKQFADTEDSLMQVDEIFLEQTLLAGDAEAKIGPIEITDNRKITPYSPYQHIFMEFREELDNGMYHIPPGEETPFTKVIRLKLIMAILRASRKKGGCQLEVNRMLFKGDILALYPLHDRKVTEPLEAQCTGWKIMPWEMPTHDLKDYFGEKIALYCVFIAHYSLFLILPAVVGLVFQLVVWGTGDYSHPVIAFYSLIICIWAIVMLEYWKRQQAHTAMQWGMTEFEAEEPERPEFEGHQIKSFVTGKDMLYFPPEEKSDSLAQSATVVCAYMLLVVGVVSSIYVMRFSLQGQIGTLAAVLASVINTVQIVVFNFIYRSVVIKLTDHENPRTDTIYEDSMIVKLFVFQFVNSYASFFFIAFIAGYLTTQDAADDDAKGQCGATTCMEPLSINLAIIFGTRLTLTNFLDIFLPYVAYKQKVKKETEGVEDPTSLTPAEQDYMLMDYDGLVEGIQNYADTTIQYGFLMLFITALPCAAFVSLVGNYFKAKLNLWKLVTFYQRPVPTGAQDMGTWLSIFQFLSTAAVVTNSALICFTMDVLPYGAAGKLWVFIGFQWALITTQFLAQEIITDVPEEVEVQMDRQAFIRSKVIDKVADDDDDGDEGGGEGPEGVSAYSNTVTLLGVNCLLPVCCRKHGVKRAVNGKKWDAPDVVLQRYPARPTSVKKTSNPMQEP